jgi:hypothetical protein
MGEMLDALCGKRGQAERAAAARGITLTAMATPKYGLTQT